MDFDFIVVGAGLMGSAAARYLSESGARVAVIGPDEPADPRTHDGVFASHYDQGRLTMRLSRDVIWSRIARRAMARYRWLEEESGVPFYNPVGMVWVDGPGPPSPDATPLKIAAAEHVPYTLWEPGDCGWQQDFSLLDFPADYWLLHEPAPAGYINPRALVQAQLTIAAAQGATIMSELVVGTTETAHGVQVTTADGGSYRANRLLVAAGAFSNFNGLLPRPIPLKPKTETTILGRVSTADAQRLAAMPVVMYQIDDPQIDDIYMAPPIRYPDGQFYVKVGANTEADLWPTTLSEVQAWFRNGESDACKEAMARALRATLPITTVDTVKSKRCLVCYTSGGHPIIDQMGERVFVAAGGNGTGAKGSDTLGWLAAALMLGQPWPDNLPRENFRIS